MKDTLVIDEGKDAHIIGSFRNDPYIQKNLPKDIYEALFSEIPDNLDMSKLITLKTNKVNFNNGAFGHAYDDVIKLSFMLREFSEFNPEVFYDQVCLPLINHTYEVAENFFGTEKVLLVPNCTTGMRCIAEMLIRELKHTSVACVQPIYGATAKLLQYFETKGHIEPIVSIAPGINPLTEEDPDIIVNNLEKAYRAQEFSVLFCDQVASQSGRVLPLEAIVDFCERRGVKLVIDGTQSCQLFFGSQKDVLRKVDYFVMSTHKWIGNAKTCGVMLFKDHAPTPPVISFGWDRDFKAQESIVKIRAQYMWQGMSDSYVSYITLAKALKIFSKYGEEQFFMSSSVMKTSILKYLQVKPLLSENKDRVLNICDLSSSQMEPLKDTNKIQQVFQDYGIFVSVKKFGESCGGITIDGHLLKNSQQNQNDSNSSNLSGAACSLKAVQKYYLRISCWSFNKEEDFQSLGFLLNNNLQLSTTTNEGLRHQFLFMYELYEKLFSVLKPKAFFVRAERLRHHLIFYYGHTAVFFTNKLVVSGHLHPSHRFDPRLESSLSVGVDEMSWDDMLEENYDWSGLDDAGLERFLKKVQEYREWVKQLVLKLIDENPIVHPIAPRSLHWILLMGIEHEKIHLETSAAIVSQVPIELIKKKHKFNYLTYWKTLNANIASHPSEAPLNKLVHIPGGTISMGKDHVEKDLYGWDNEFGNEKKTLKDFEVSQMLVSNSEYLGFVKDGGYEKKGEKWWSVEGWKYVTQLGVSGPKFWMGRTHYRALLEVISMPWNLPVEVNNLEAEAFCNWKSERLGKKLRLLSHDESFHMRQQAVNETSNNNLNKFASPTPVDMYGGVINGKKIYDISGNVWRHSVSILTVMDGFKTDPYYNDFTLPTVDGFHNHILGGSWISLGNCANLNSRYGFRRHFYQYAGIRYVASDNTYHNKVPRMFDEVITTRFITEHYTNFTIPFLVNKIPVENWPKLLGEKAADVINKHRPTKEEIKVFTAHGGPGRFALELLRKCSNLVIDHTDETANKLKVLESLLQNSRIQWYQQIEGKITEGLDYHLDGDKSEVLLDKKGNRITYWQADYQNLRSQLDSYDVIVADIRQKDSAVELAHMAGRLKEGGLLVLGTIDDTSDGVEGDEKHSLAVLKEHFIRIEGPTEQYPHAYRETRSKHQYMLSYYSVWKKESEKSNVEEGKEAKQYSTPSSDEVSNTTDYYEDQHILSSYHSFHFGDGFLSVKNFPLRMSEVIIEACKKYQCPMGRALDAGCGPGRTAIELASAFEEVEAYDYSHGFIKLLMERANGKITNLKAYQGDSHQQETICEGWQLKPFDMIFGCNLIDRLHSPELWVEQSKKMLSSKGLLVIASPYTWKPEHTAPEKWIGGFKRNGEDMFTVDGLRILLAPELVLLEKSRVPFVIPDADGTYQYTYSNCTIFGAPR